MANNSFQNKKITGIEKKEGIVLEREWDTVPEEALRLYIRSCPIYDIFVFFGILTKILE